MDGWNEYSPSGTETGIFNKTLNGRFVIITSQGVTVCRAPVKERLNFPSHNFSRPGLKEFLAENGLASFQTEIEAVVKRLRGKEDGEDGFGDLRLKLKPVPDEDPEDEDGPRPR